MDGSPARPAPLAPDAAPAAPGRARLAALTLLTLGFFAANSLLARAALRPGLADAATFTAIRLASGAAALALLALASRRARPRGGSAGSALALFAYAAAFSLAYRRIDAGPGAFLLFFAVQATMVGWSVLRGARPARRQWAGLAVALAGLGWLTLPGAHAPDARGAALMLAAGVAWGAYTLRGRGVRDPAGATAANFALAVPLALALVIASAGSVHLTARGAALAAASGAVASGVGYVLWYTVVPALGAARAAAVQLAVPAIVPLAAAGLLGEAITPRLFAAGTAILAGVALAIAPAPQPARSSRASA
ncbi:EamA family transporter [Anaeromyxobacter sp. Red801]|uniref:EamA family transporter n=1 Tax=Anaeromyxobacter sp. Red801 TaxID=3411632 RepID=UPI003BA08A44